MQTQQEQKQSTGTERVKMESRPQPSDKVKPKSDVKSRSSKITDNASKTSGRKRGLGNAESENAVKRQKVPKVTAQDTDQPGASETAAGIVTGMEEAGVHSSTFSLFSYIKVTDKVTRTRVLFQRSYLRVRAMLLIRVIPYVVLFLRL